MKYEIEAVAHIKTPYKQKFGTPRQPGLIEEAWGEIIFEKKYANRDALRGLDQVSHLWLIFLFNQNPNTNWSPLVRPPRLGGKEKIGLWSTRSPFRPNPLGLSVVKLEGVIDHDKTLAIRVSGVDLVDGTPIFDIKPYISYADKINNSYSWAQQEPNSKYSVIVSSSCEKSFSQLTTQEQQLIIRTLKLDPRPPMHDALAKSKGDEWKERQYHMKIMDWDIRWRLINASDESCCFEIFSIKDPV